MQSNDPAYLTQRYKKPFEVATSFTHDILLKISFERWHIGAIQVHAFVQSVMIINLIMNAVKSKEIFKCSPVLYAATISLISCIHLHGTYRCIAGL